MRGKKQKPTQQEGYWLFWISFLFFLFFLFWSEEKLTRQLLPHLFGFFWLLFAISFYFVFLSFGLVCVTLSSLHFIPFFQKEKAKNFFRQRTNKIKGQREREGFVFGLFKLHLFLSNRVFFFVCPLCFLVQNSLF